MVTIIDYGVGNIASIQNMLKKIGAKSIITNEIEIISNAEKIILPGVGHFDTCAKKLQESNTINILNKKVLQDKTPIMGICVGMQLLFNESEEGNLKGLNWVEGSCVKFDNEKVGKLKIPHMGWTDVSFSKSSKLLENMNDETRFYFVHSYHAQLINQKDELLSAKYGYNFTCAVEKENIIGVQFHPEKSHKFGMKILENFIQNY